MSESFRSPDKSHSLADEIDAYVRPLAPHVASRTAAQLLRKASAALREPTAEVESEWKQAVAMHGNDWQAIARRMARVASTFSTRSHVGQINEHPAGNRTNAGTGERSPDQPREVGRTPTHEPATANREDTERDRAEGSGGRELGHDADRGGLDAAPCAPSTTPQKREWEGYCTAEEEATIKEIESIYSGNGRDWGQMRAIALMVIRVRKEASATPQKCVGKWVEASRCWNCERGCDVVCAAQNNRADGGKA